MDRTACFKDLRTIPVILEIAKDIEELCPTRGLSILPTRPAW